MVDMFSIIYLTKESWFWLDGPYRPRLLLAFTRLSYKGNKKKKEENVQEKCERNAAKY